MVVDKENKQFFPSLLFNLLIRGTAPGNSDQKLPVVETIGLPSHLPPKGEAAGSGVRFPRPPAAEPPLFEEETACQGPAVVC